MNMFFLLGKMALSYVIEGVDSKHFSLGPRGFSRPAASCMNNAIN